VSSPALAQTSTAATTATTTIVRPVTIQKDSNLIFGTIIRPTAGTSVVSLPSGSDTVSADGTGVAILGGTSRAKYTIAGEGGQAVSITVPGTFSMTRVGGSETLLVSLSSDLGASTSLSSSLGNAGTKNLNVGGSFELSTGSLTGAYSGTFDVTVAYQ